MMRHNYLILLVVIAGILLRCVDIAIPDLATDEAQFALGNSAAQPPLGMAFLRASQVIFGANLIAVRLPSILFGIMTLPLMYLITREIANKRAAMMALAVSAIFPSHIYFSRLAYLSVPLFFSWALLLYAFLRSRNASASARNARLWLIAVFAASIFCTMIKTQGLLLPVMLALGTLLEKRKLSILSYQFSIINSQLSILVLSLIPISLYIATSPGIAATLAQHGGGTYGLSNISERIIALAETWIRMTGIFLIVVCLSMPAWKKLPWPVLVFMIIGAGIGLILGPGHSYYSAHLLIFAIPIAVMLIRMKPFLQNVSLGVFLSFTLMTLGPGGITPTTAKLFAHEGVWNAHAHEINASLKGAEAVTVLGDPGHHVRWYLEPRVLVGKHMEPPYPTTHVLQLNDTHAATLKP